MTMSKSHTSVVGKVVAICRYPVKSMMGEELNATEVTEHGLLGDRAFALVDMETGKVASAKNPRVWPNLFDYRASYLQPPGETRSLPPVRITFPNGESLTTDQADVEHKLSAELGRTVRVAQTSTEGAISEGYWPDHDWLAERDEVFEFPLPQGTFFDCSPIHLLTTATLDRLRASSPANRFEVPRFRPNFVIESTHESEGFVENDWIGQTLALGEVMLRIEGPCPRCIMTTLSQGSLPKDPGVLRAAVKHNDGNIGVYATVIAGGRVCRGDTIKVS